jgi:hypothetical protein
MEISPELASTVDQLCERHPTFRRITVERLVVRIAGEFQEGGAPAPLSTVRRLADEQLRYVDEGNLEWPLRKSG